MVDAETRAREVVLRERAAGLSQHEVETIVARVAGDDPEHRTVVFAFLSGENTWKTGGGWKGKLFAELERGVEEAWSGRVEEAGARVGERIGRVELVELLGVGGMGEVYRGRDAVLERDVAVKCLRRDRSLSAAARARVRREAQLLARLDHPGICGLFDLVEDPDGDVLVLELVDGTDLDRAIRAGIAPERQLRIGIEILDALGAAHSKGVIHRDLKPSNVLVTPEGRVKVLDFGIARSEDGVGGSGPSGGSKASFEGPTGPRLTLEGTVVGTISYMSPEQARGEPLSTATDLYSFGILLLEMTTRRLPYTGGTPAELMEEVRRAAPTIPAELDPELGGFLGRLLAADPAVRPTAPEARDALERILTRASRRRRLWVRLGVAAAAIAGLAGIVALGVERWRSVGEARLADRLEPEVQWVSRAMQHAFTEPVHDVAPERAEARERLLRVEESLRSEGREGSRVARAALGRGYLALGDVDRSLEHLRAAWDAGARQPDVAVALGRATSAAYERWLRYLEDTAPGEERELLAREGARELRDPAREILAQARGAGLEAPELVEALVAAYSDEPERALRLLDEAKARLPWLYEADRIAARIHEEQGRRAAEEQGESAAVEHYERARARLESAAAIGRSDPRVHGQLCELHHRILVGAVHLSASADQLREHFESGDAACRTAAAVDSESAVFDTWGAIHSRYGEALFYRGVDAREHFARAIELIERDLELQPDAATWDQLGIVLDLVAYDQNYRGEEPLATLDRAMAAYREAQRLEPTRRSLPAHMLYALLVRTTWLTENGGDPHPVVEEARAIYDAAVARDPAAPNVHNNFGVIVLYGAIVEGWRGGDPRPGLDEAAAAFERELAHRPGHAFATGNVAHALAFRAEAELARGLDPRATVERARVFSERALALQPDLYFALADAGRLDSVEALRSARTGGDPAEVGRLFARAEAWGQRAVDAKSDDTWTRRYHAELAVRRAEHAAGTGEDPGPWIRAAIERADEALRLNPRNAEALWVQCRARGIEARVGGGPARERAAAEARRLGAETLRLNGNLRRPVEEILALLPDLVSSRSLPRADRSSPRSDRPDGSGGTRPAQLP